MRGLSIGTLLVALVLAAGCGGGAVSGEPAGEASKPADEVVDDALKAAKAASSVRVLGRVADAGQNVEIELSLARDKGATGSVAVRGAEMDLVVIGDKAYVRADAALWRRFGEGPLGMLLGGEWLLLPAKNPKLEPFLGFADEETLFDELSSHGKLENQGETTYKGQRVVAIHDVTENATLYVAASGTPYPIGLVKTDDPRKRGLTFDRWNEPVELTAPKDAIDTSKLQG